jgi:hypothetical protein
MNGKIDKSEAFMAVNETGVLMNCMERAVKNVFYNG